MSNDKYRELFFDESDEYLEILNDCLLILEKNPDEEKVLEEIFRAAHTLKGMAATMGYDTMTELTHKMESVFELFRSGEVKVTSDIVSLIFECLDKLSEIVDDLRVENHKDYDISDVLAQLEQISKETKDIEIDLGPGNSEIQLSDSDLLVVSNAREEGYHPYRIKVRISKDTVLKGARAYLVVNKLEQEGEIISSFPSAELMEEGEFDDSFELIYITKLDLGDVRQIVENIVEVEEVKLEKISSQADRTRKKSNKKDRINKDKQVSSHTSQTIRVDIEKLDVFMNLVSELVIHRTRLESLCEDIINPEIHESLEQVSRITSELQDVVLNIRMQPVALVFNRFPRMIRDISQELGKEIDLVIEGEDTELDRVVVSEIGEPLVHLMRNAVDHGIERVEDRLALGKSEKGTIRLAAYQEGNRVVIVVSDDGKGLDPQALKESAEKKEIDTEGMNDQELINLIFNQGFSTAKNVTNLSGRGVGMDVVKQKILSLGGDIHVRSEVNKGTSFIIRLPLTLSIIQALLVEVGGEVFALPLSLIEKIETLEDTDILESHNKELYIYRDKAIPIIRVNEKLGMDFKDRNQYIVIARIGDEYYGLLVEDVLAQQEIVIKKLGLIIKKTGHYLGATILGNGDITLILDVQALCSEGENNGQED